MTMTTRDKIRTLVERLKSGDTSARPELEQALAEERQQAAPPDPSDPEPTERRRRIEAAKANL
ncbi:MAG TPA: hypothetical protein VK838_00460 [Candidatus Limnocylindrales bacterium]|nr:hypothetical protein [Candidatus Limnocylindrales bacterium]